MPIWSVDDVSHWVSRIGFEEYLDYFLESGVDGDLLLQLDEANIREDLKILNGIHRKRFVRELDKLKKQADYSNCDKHGVASFLLEQPQLGEDFLVYTYGFLLQGLGPDLMRRLSGGSLDDALKEAGVHNPVHRQRIADAVLRDCLPPDEVDHVCEGFGEADPNGYPNYDVYICNASPLSHGSGELASLIEVNLNRCGLTTVRLGDVLPRSGDKERSAVIGRCNNFVLILTKGSLDVRDQSPRARAETSMLHSDLVAALNSPDCKIIPVMDPEFQFPDPDDIPEDVRQICSFNAIRWVHEYQNACIGKLERFIKGEPWPSLKQSLTYSNRLHSSTPAFLTVNYGAGPGTRSRNDSGRSTPTWSLTRHHSPPGYHRSRPLHGHSHDHGGTSPNPGERNRRRNVSFDCLLVP